MFRMGAKTKQSLEQGFGDPYTISIVRNTRNSTGNHLGPYVTPCYGGLDPFRVPRTVKQGCFGLLGQIFITAYLIYHIAPKTLKILGKLYSETKPASPTHIWVVVKIMGPFGVPNIVRHLIFRVPKKGPQF